MHNFHTFGCMHPENFSKILGGRIPIYNEFLHKWDYSTDLRCELASATIQNGIVGLSLKLGADCHNFIFPASKIIIKSPRKGQTYYAPGSDKEKFELLEGLYNNFHYVERQLNQYECTTKYEDEQLVINFINRETEKPSYKFIFTGVTNVIKTDQTNDDDEKYLLEKSVRAESVATLLAAPAPAREKIKSGNSPTGKLKKLMATRPLSAETRRELRQHYQAGDFFEINLCLLEDEFEKAQFSMYGPSTISAGVDYAEIYMMLKSSASIITGRPATQEQKFAQQVTAAMDYIEKRLPIPPELLKFFNNYKISSESDNGDYMLLTNAPQHFKELLKGYAGKNKYYLRFFGPTAAQYLFFKNEQAITQELFMLNNIKIKESAGHADNQSK